jgi:hypothetical protein
VLPWAKHSYFWQFNQIYNAEYRQDWGFFCWLFRFGSIIIVGRSGVRDQYVIPTMPNPEDTTALINRYAKGGG